MKASIYLDSAASSLKSQSVIDAQVNFLKTDYANSGRGTCARSVATDNMLFCARKKVADFLSVKSDNIIFTSGATDGFNRISNMMPQNAIVVVSDLDHHSARLPFEQKNKTIVCPLNKNFDISIPDMISIVEKNNITAVVITAMSNVLGAPQDVKKIIEEIHKINKNIITIVDAAQYVCYLPINAENWGADVIIFSGHKIGADTGVGVMYLKDTYVWNTDKFGGGMVKSVAANGATGPSKLIYADGPDKFEAGTLPLTQIAGLSFAIDELKTNGTPDLIKYLYSELSKSARIKILSSKDAMVITFIITNMHCLDFGTLAGAYGICIRAGNMCASWLHNAMGYNSGTIRISVGNWNTIDEIKTTAMVFKKILGA